LVITISARGWGALVFSRGLTYPLNSILRVPKTKRRKNGGGNTSSKLERLNIARLRTNTAEFAQTVRGSFTDLNSGGIGSQSYAVFLNYPSYRVTAGGVISQCTYVTGLLANEQKVFDEYKVTRLKIKYMPWVTGQVRVASAVAYTAASSPLMVVGLDLDDSALWTTRAKALGTQNPGIYNRYCDRLLTFSMSQRDPVDKQKWLNLGALIPSASAPPDPNNPSKLSCIKFFIDGYLLMGSVEGEIFCEWTVIFKGSYTLA